MDGKVTLSGNYTCKVCYADRKAAGDYVIQAIFIRMFMHTHLMENFLDFFAKSFKSLQLEIWILKGVGIGASKLRLYKINSAV